MARTILTVDDNQEFLQLIELLLKNAGFQVLQADSVSMASNLLEKSLPDAILLDLMMPDRNGLEFLENLRWDSRFEKIPVIVLTAMTLTQEQREFIDTFSAACLDKTKTPEVVECLNRILPE